MPTHCGVTPRTAAVRISFVPAVVFVSMFVRGLAAQTLHPFEPPRSCASFSMSAAAGILDVNRDASPDVLVPGPFAGTLLTTLDENGVAVVTNGTGPAVAIAPGSSFPPAILAMTSGAFDGDDRDDLVTVTAVGSVHFHRNLGSSRPDRASFAPDTLVDSLLAGWPISPLFVNYAFPAMTTCDLDEDGILDVLLAGGPVNRVSGNTIPGVVAFYRGLGGGTFQAMHHTLSGSAIDLEVADLDGNGHVDHVVVLVENGASGVFSNELVHLAYGSGTFAATGWPQPVGPGRMTCLAIADVLGDGNPDYLLGQVATVGGALAGLVYCFGGDGNGNVVGSSWGLLPLSANTTGLGDFIASVQTGDWNRDGHVDVAVLRGFVQAPPTYSALTAQFADAELLVAMGPNVGAATFESIVLPGHLTYSGSTTAAFAYLPLVSAPDALRTLDLGGDGSVDFAVPALWTTGNQPRLATLRNATPPAAGDACFTRIGDPSGGDPDHPARLGFEGGRPVPGNAAFAVTVQNLEGGCVAGVIWGPIGIPNLFVAYGITANLAPLHYGTATLVGGSGPGDGFLSVPMPIPPVPALVGDAGCFQVAFYDHVRDVFGGTQATGLWIGN